MVCSAAISCHSSIFWREDAKSVHWIVASTTEYWPPKAMEPTILCKSHEPKNARDFGIKFVFYQKSCRKSQCNADEKLNRVFKILSSQENDIVRPRTITHLGRDLKFETTCGQVLFSTFEELCDKVRVFVFYLLCSVVLCTVLTLFNAILFRFKFSLSHS